MASSSSLLLFIFPIHIYIQYTHPFHPRQVSVVSMVVTVGVCFIIVCELVMVSTQHRPHPGYDTATPITFVLGFSTFLFSYGGARGFPTIQNDMADRSQFWKSVIVCNVGEKSRLVAVLVGVTHTGHRGGCYSPS